MDGFPGDSRGSDILLPTKTTPVFPRTIASRGSGLQDFVTCLISQHPVMLQTVLPPRSFATWFIQDGQEGTSRVLTAVLFYPAVSLHFISFFYWAQQLLNTFRLGNRIRHTKV